MQKQTSNQKDFVDKELLDTLKKSYYFYLEEKFRLHQRASFLFILLVPMFAILFQLSKTYDYPQILEFFFIALLTITLFFSVFSCLFFRTEESFVVFLVDVYAYFC